MTGPRTQPDLIGEEGKFPKGELGPVIRGQIPGGKTKVTDLHSVWGGGCLGGRIAQRQGDKNG